MTPRSLALALAAMVVAADAQPAAADQSDPRLYGLFARLRMVTDQADIRDITGNIWSIWYQTGRPEIDSLMQEGRRFLKNGPLHSALGNFSTIVKWAPEFAEGWHKRAEVHFRMGNFQSSIKDLEMAVSLEPRHYGALAALGLIYLKLGDEHTALEELEEALRVNPHLPGTRSKVEELREKLYGKKI